MEIGIPEDDMKTPKAGKLFMATVGGQDCAVYTSLETEEKGDNRKHCYRYAPPSNEIIGRNTEVVLLHPIETIDTTYARSVRKNPA